MPERKIALVTGAAAGVGRATARLFAQRGFDVALLAGGKRA
jgi:NAD(P)-dependent dehydrogenase (short-subunit alcohol dehydrogenase family)